MTQQTKLLTSAAIFSLGLFGHAQASDSEYAAPSYIMVETGQDGPGNKDESISIDLSILNSNRLMLFGHRSQDNDKTTPQNHTASIGFSTDPSKKYSVELKHERSSQEHTSSTFSHSITLHMNLNNWGISLGGDKREIQLSASAEARRLRVNPITSQSHWLSLGYYGWQTASASIYYRKHNYGLHLDQMIAIPRWQQRIFSQNTMSTVWGLNKSQKGFSINHYFDRGYINYSRDEMTTEIGEAVYIYNTIRGGYDLTQHWSLELAAGTSNLGDETIKWNSAALAYRW